MRQYEIVIEEILRKKIKILAENEDDSLNKIKSMYKHDEIVLYPEDYISTNYKIENTKEVDENYLQKYICLDDNPVKIDSIVDNVFYAVEATTIQDYDLTLVKKEKDTLWCCHIKFVDDCPQIEADIVFYFECTDHEYFILLFECYKTFSLNELSNIIEQLQQRGLPIENGFKVRTEIPFQELNAVRLHEINKNTKFLNKDKIDEFKR